MTTIRTMIVDDEEPARVRLRSLLKPFVDVEVVGEAENGEQALENIALLKPDLVFLDIQMPGCTGIEVAASLPAGSPRIIFCTAFDEYAIDAFEVRAVDYLLKPVARARLAKALERVRQGADQSEAVDGVVQDSTPARFLGKRGSRFKVVPVSEVLCFLSEGGLTQLWTADQYYWMEPTLLDLERRLGGSGFFRISRQALVNLDRVDEVVPLVGGHGQVKLSGGRVLDVSRRRMKDLMEELEGK
jgi:two-component system, LytTR family, response regulator